MIKTRNVGKSFGKDESEIEVLKDIEIKIDSGGLTVILGASGSGKSTLLNVLSGLERPDKGDIFYNDINITELTDRELTYFRKEEIGFVFQQYYLLPNIDVDKNVKMSADLAGNRNYRSIIEAVGLGDKIYKYPAELSGGEQQRVSIARALSKKPKFLFLDEPTGALDEKTGRQVLNLITDLKKEYDFTAVMVTHNENISEMADTVIKINSGKIIQVCTNGSPKNAYEIGW